MFNRQSSGYLNEYMILLSIKMKFYYVLFIVSCYQAMFNVEGLINGPIPSTGNNLIHDESSVLFPGNPPAGVRQVENPGNSSDPMSISASPIAGKAPTVRNEAKVPRRMLTKEEKSTIETMYKEGTRVSDIAKQTAIPPNTVSSHLSRTGLITPRRTLTPEEKSRIETMDHEGTSLNDIVKSTGINPFTVTSHLRMFRRGSGKIPRRKLTPEEISIIETMDNEGSYPFDIANHLRINPYTVTTHLHRFRKRTGRLVLKNRLKNSNSNITDSPLRPGLKRAPPVDSLNGEMEIKDRD